MKSSIKLRESKEEDYPFIYNIIKDFLKTDLSVTFLDLPDYEEFKKTYFSNDFKRYIITDEKLEDLGFVVLTKGDEVGYFLKPECQKKGIAVEAVRITMELNPRKRYFATIHNENKRSINLATKLGFKPKGTIYEKIIED
jgi:RimJ/RimL family protein N-acetyltransferase